MSKDAGNRYVIVGPGTYLNQALTNGTVALTYSGATRWWVDGTTGNFYVLSNGLKPGGGPWTDSSDERIKTVAGNYEPGLDEVLQLQPVRYTFKGNDTNSEPQHLGEPGTDPATLFEELTVPYPNSPHRQAAIDGTEFVGLIAQAVEPIFPGMVSDTTAYIDGEPVTDLKQLNTTELIFALVNSVKTLAGTVRAAESRRTSPPPKKKSA
jgi:hypothetical protein